MKKIHYESPFIRRTASLSRGAALLSGSIVNNTTTQSEGQGVSQYSWGDGNGTPGSTFNHEWE